MDTFIYFWLNYSDKINHIEGISVAVKNIDHLFHMASEILESDKLRLLFFLMVLESMKIKI